MKAESGSLIFIKDEHDPLKRRPFICVHVFTNNAKVPYNWWVIPITSKNTIGLDNLVEIKHQRLSTISWAKINDLHSIKWNDDYEIAQRKFAKRYIKDVKDKIVALLSI